MRLVALLVLLTACGGSSTPAPQPAQPAGDTPAQSALDSYRKLRDEMCACQNIHCMAEVQREIRTLGDNHRASLFSPEQAQEKQRLVDEADECSKHVPREQ